ncbi:MAG: type II toxin-antitoxin system YafQ family toxin [Synergistaceae bacterium]|nr:type II toxin-antitoxin system YafQ family toxin [Synergistaceae bacterium]
MRHAEPTSGFRHDVKRERKGIYRGLLTKGGELDRVVKMLERGIPLPPKYRDHQLHGEREGSRECHVRPDFLLVYRLEGEDLLVLERLGSHAELFEL